jgi:hypothetical protein
VSGSISLEDQSAYRQSQILNVSTPQTIGSSLVLGALNQNSGASAYGGNSVPDIVGQLRVDQAWGLFQLSGALHDVYAGYYNPTLETSGHPSTVWGGAVMAALSIKNIPTGPGDTINMDATWANGASRYVIGGVSPNSFGMFGSTGLPGVYQSIAFGASADGIFGLNTSIEKNTAWGFRGAYTHNWSPTWSSSLFGSYSSETYTANGKALFCAGLAQVFGAGGAGTTSCNPNFTIAQVGAVTRWTPVKNLTFSTEVMYTQLHSSMSGVTGPISILAAGSTKPPGVSYEFKDQGTITGLVRAQRVF